MLAQSQKIHEMPLPMKLRISDEEGKTYACTVHLVFADRLPQKVYGYFPVPPHLEKVSAIIEEWYGFQVALGPWSRQEGGLTARPLWEAPVLSLSRVEQAS